MASDQRKQGRGRHAKPETLQYGSRTDVGLVRDHNEDSLAVAEPLFAVADGMGGHAAGEVASEVAIQALMEFAPTEPDGDELARAVIAANRAVIRAAHEGRGRQGMGTTMTAAVLCGTRLIVAQVGDSRAYLLHHGALQRITRDHSLVADLVESGQITEAEARVHPRRSVITRALGSDPNTLPDIYEMNLEDGDRLLLCSDGLSSMIEDSLIESTLSRVADPQRCADALVDEALAAGGADNVTCIVVDVAGTRAATAAKARRRSRAAVIVGVIALLAVIGGTIAGGSAYLNHTAFVVAQGDDVVVCRGIPGEVLGVPTWSLDHDTDLSLSTLDLPENTKERLASEGIRVDSVEAADELVKTWQSQSTKEDDAREGDRVDGAGDTAAASDARAAGQDASGGEAGDTADGSAQAEAGDAS